MPIIKDAFNDLKATPLPETEGIGGYDDLRNVSAIQVGTGARAFKADQDGIFLGANKFATALFSVTMAGKVVATDGTFSGAITAATIDIGGADATSFHVDIDGNIWSGAAAFADGLFKVSNAGALTATGATISGAITATSGAIGGFTIESGYLYAGTGANTCGLSPADYPFWAGDTYANRATAPFKVTPAGDVTVGSLTITGGSIVGTAGDVIKMYDTVGGTQYGEIGYHTTYGVYLASIASADMYILGQGNTSLTSSGGSVLIDGSSGSEKVGLKGADTGSANSSGVWLWDHDASTYVEKTAIVKTSQGFRTLYCIESPEVWFMDFCKTKNKIDPLFLEVTEKPYHFIKCEDGEYQVWGKRNGLAEKRFEEKTKNESIKNNDFWSTPLKMAR